MYVAAQFVDSAQVDNLLTAKIQPTTIILGAIQPAGPMGYDRSRDALPVRCPDARRTRVDCAYEYVSDYILGHVYVAWMNARASDRCCIPAAPH